MIKHDWRQIEAPYVLRDKAVLYGTRTSPEIGREIAVGWHAYD